LGQAGAFSDAGRQLLRLARFLRVAADQLFGFYAGHW
jgi:hypothetical protein